MTAANLTINSIVTHNAVLDFDGDGHSDEMLVRNAGGAATWYGLQSWVGFTSTAWGLEGDHLVPADYDGDNMWDIAVWRSGNFYILQSATNSLRAVQFGQAGDDPRITQDYDGDGKADPAVTRVIGGNQVFYILKSMLGFTANTFGLAGVDFPIRGDFDGDGRADIAVYRNGSGTPANTFFVLQSSNSAVIGRSFGNFINDFIVPGDFDGDGKTDLAVWRGASGDGNWYWLRSSDGALGSVNFGLSAVDRPVPGDYDGDGKTDPAVWRIGPPSYFYHLGAVSGFTAVNFGLPGDYPVGFTLQVR